MTTSTCNAMRRRQLKKTAGFFFVTALAVHALAGAPKAQEEGVRITISDELILTPGDPRQNEPVRDEEGNLVTRPGDIIRYTLTAVNGGPDTAHEVEMVDPVPEGTEYVPGSATGSNMSVTYSVDGGHYFQPLPIMEDFRNPDGTTVRRAVPASRYTHVKWRVDSPVPPGSSVQATFNVRVTSAIAPEGAADQ